MKSKIKIQSTSQVYEIESDIELVTGQEILVESDQILESAIVLCNKNCPKQKEEIKNDGSGIKVLRILTEEDLDFRKELVEKAKEFIPEAKQKVLRHNLDMKIIDAEISLDEKKITFYFSAEGRIDFRALVADMVGSFHKIIRLQQVGPREAAKKFGGFGKCGREVCCKRFLDNPENITIQMANSQDISNTKSGKVLGCCGKLMCCLSFETDYYQEVRAKMPKIGTMLSTTEGEGKVVGHNILESKAILETKDGKKIEVLV